MKGWKKQGPIKRDNPQDRKEKLKRIYDQEAAKIRKQLSIAKAEIERLKENRKITKKGRKNRSHLQKECKTISVAGLISYMEKKKSELRKLKRGFDRKKKQEVSRVINQQFNAVPGRGFANLSGMLKRDPENERAGYKDPRRRARDDSKMFENIEEASGFLDKAVVRERDWEQERGLIAGSEDRPPRASTTTDRQRTGSRSSGSGQSPVQESQLERARA